ncbi:MAG: SDR family oxidoreductase [Acidobacteria bacterium]|nr:SDR family oxidoreductase [Acidobacteriota bacterium]
MPAKYFDRNPQSSSEPPSPVALITGGSAGIGAACVQQFLVAGWRIAVVALPDPDLDWLRSLGVLVIPGDITSERVRDRAINETVAEFGRIDLLVNNAGIGLYSLPSAVPIEHFSRMLEVNVVAPLALAQLVIPVMLGQGFGTIVTMGSVASRVALPWASAYSAAKAALCSLHDSLRLELRGSPIHLIVVHPGIVDTGFRDNVLAGGPPAGVKRIRYVVSPETVASAIFRAVKRRRSSVYVPAIGFLFEKAGALVPAVLNFYLSHLNPPSWKKIEPRSVATAANGDQ